MITPGGSIKVRRVKLRKSLARVRCRLDRPRSFSTSAARAQKKARRASVACTLPASAVFSTRACRRCCLWINWLRNQDNGLLQQELQQPACGGKPLDTIFIGMQDHICAAATGSSNLFGAQLLQFEFNFVFLFLPRSLQAAA